MFIDNGEIIESGPPGQIFTSPQFDLTKLFLEPGFEIICWEQLNLDNSYNG